MSDVRLTEEIKIAKRAKHVIPIEVLIVLAPVNKEECGESYLEGARRRPLKRFAGFSTSMVLLGESIIVLLRGKGGMNGGW